MSQKNLSPWRRGLNCCENITCSNTGTKKGIKHLKSRQTQMHSTQEWAIAHMEQAHLSLRDTYTAHLKGNVLES